MPPKVGEEYMSICFCYIVGGSQDHYNNLTFSIKSIRRLVQNPFFYILELGNKQLQSSIDTLVFHQPLPKTDGKIGYLFWREKYNIVQNTTFDKIVYLDTDTVLVNNNLDDLFEQIDDKVGVCQHFWVPTIQEFRSKAIGNPREFLDYAGKYQPQDSDLFFGGGVFLLKNTEENIEIMREIGGICDDIYQAEYVSGGGMTDELFLSRVLNKTNQYHLLPGSLNHCLMGDEHMPLIVRDDILCGNNTWEHPTPITFFHCDPNRRAPEMFYDGEVKQQVKSLYNNLKG